MIWALAASLLLLFNQVQGHGYMSEPKSRNYRAAVDVDWNNCLVNGGGCNTPNVPRKENTPQGLNNAKNTVSSQCGVAQEGGPSYDTPLNWAWQPLSWQSQAVYQQGSTISVKVTLTAYHWGFFEFYACPRNQPITEACFKQNPLTFVQDRLHGAVKDNNFPNRAYAKPPPGWWQFIDPNIGDTYDFLMKLPSGLSGDVLIQWVYITANSFNPPGYTQYPFPWPNGFANLPPGIGERFWNCAEVTISGGPVGPNPVPMPVQMPVPMPTSTGTCGGGNRGNGVCSNGQCCSQWGWCGTGSAYCTGPAPVAPAPIAPPPTNQGTCGGGNRGNGLCSSGLCCSQWGWCGTGSAYCTGTVTKLGDWSVCSSSSQCSNGCCSGMYSGGILKCTPLGSGFSPSANGCVSRRLLHGNETVASSGEGSA